MPKHGREPDMQARLRLTDLKEYNDERPDQLWDETFKELVIDQTAAPVKKLKTQGDTWGDKNRRMIHEILQQAKLPVADTELHEVYREADPSYRFGDSDDGTAHGDVEALYLTSEEAYDYLVSDLFHPQIPIVVYEGVAPEYAEQGKRPIETFFKWQEDLDRKLSVQVPSNKIKNNSYKIHTLQQVKETFLYKNKRNDNDPVDEEFKNGEPWNVLDCQNPVPGTYPRFLQHRKCQLLHSIKSVVLGGMTGARIHATKDSYNGWRDNVKWTLLSEGGNLTSPHMDAHGLDTWITVQEGAFGFGWMARPTREEYVEWLEDPLHFTESEKWRYLILKPGQTVFFPSGTIHFVFRINGYQTLATGGHNIRWNALENWVQVMAFQNAYPDSCNEDQDRIKLFCDEVKRFIQQRVKHGTLEEVFGKRVRIWGQPGQFRTPQQHAEYIIGLIDSPQNPWNQKPAGKKPTGKKLAGKKLAGKTTRG